MSPCSCLSRRSRAARVAIVRAAVAVAVLVGSFSAASSPLVAQDGPPVMPPTRAQLDALKGRLGAHPFFSRVDYELVTEFAPYVFVVEAPRRRDDADYARRIVASMVTFVRELHRAFHGRYVQQLGLTRRAEAGPYVIAILASKGSYGDYADAVDSGGLHMSRAHFNPELQLAVTYEDSFGEQGGNRAARERRNTLLHEFVHAMCFAHYAGEGLMPRPQWFNEGLAEYRSYCRGLSRQLRNPEMQPEHLRVVAALMLRADLQGLLLPANELMAIDGPGYRSAAEAIQQNFGAPQITEEFYEFAMTAFYAQSCIFMHFLHVGADGKYVVALDDYLGRIMRGEASVRAYEQAFSSALRGSMDSDFIEFVQAEMKKRGLNPAAFEGVSLGGAQARDASAVVVDAPTFDYAELAWRDEDWKLRLAQVLRTARQGRAAEAAALAGSISAPDAETAALLARTTANLEAWGPAGRRLLGEAQAGRKMLTFEVGGKRQRGKVQELTDGLVVLKFGSREFSVRIPEIDAAAWLAIGDKLKAFDGKDAWLGAWLATLQGETGGSRFGSDERSRQIRRDAAVLGELQSAKLPGSAWMAVAELRPAGDAQAARAQLDELRGLVREHGRDSYVRERRAQLEQLARYLTFTACSAGDPTMLGLHGKVDDLGQGRFRVRYDFSDPAQLDDFLEGGDALAWFRDALPASSGAVRSGVRIEKGQLTMSGEQCRRLAVAVEAPLKIDFEVSLDDIAFFFLGACSDRENRCFAVSEGGGLLAVNLARRAVDMQSQNRMLRQGQKMQVGLVHDGETVKTTFGGNTVKTSDQGKASPSGEIFLWNHADGPVRIDNLVIEGKLDTTRLAQLAASRAETAARTLFDD